jgi:hypothetical protein
MKRISTHTTLHAALVAAIVGSGCTDRGRIRDCTDHSVRRDGSGGHDMGHDWRGRGWSG